MRQSTHDANSSRARHGTDHHWPPLPSRTSPREPSLGQHHAPSQHLLASQHFFLHHSTPSITSSASRRSLNPPPLPPASVPPPQTPPVPMWHRSRSVQSIAQAPTIGPRKFQPNTNTALLGDQWRPHSTSESQARPSHAEPKPSQGQASARPRPSTAPPRPSTKAHRERKEGDSRCRTCPASPPPPHPHPSFGHGALPTSRRKQPPAARKCPTPGMILSTMVTGLSRRMCVRRQARNHRSLSACLSACACLSLVRGRQQRLSPPCPLSPLKKGSAFVAPLQ